MTDAHKKRYSKRTLSIFIAMILFACLATVAFADSAVALSSSNITVNPTVSYVNGEAMYFGQKIGDAVKLEGGQVQHNGEVVPGHFEFSAPDSRPTLSGVQRADFIFVPEDSSAFVGFEIKRSRTVTYNVTTIAPVYEDEVNAPLIATAVRAGAMLSTSVLSGGAMTNPYYPDEPKLQASAGWSWTNPNQIIHESGYYSASFVSSYYLPFNELVYVEVLADFEIAEYPTIPELTYDPNVTWADVTLSGGKAVSRATGEEVAGEFTISADVINNVPYVHNTSLAIVFTPANEADGKAYNFSIPVTVKPFPISFGSDKKGISIDDPYIFEVAPFADMGEVRDTLKNYHLNWPGTGSVQIEDYNGKAEHGRIYKYQVLNHNNSNYTGNTAYVKLVFATTEITPTIASAGSNRFKVDCGTHNPPGTFTIYHNDVEIATVSRVESYVFDCEVYTDEGGTSHIKAVYNPVENDYYVCNDAETTITVAPMHTITNAKDTANQQYPINVNVNGSGDYSGRTGSTVEMRATLDSFVCWIIKDADGKEVTLDGVDVNSKSITFLMPDCDLLVTYKTQADLDREEAIANCDHLCHSDNALIRLFWNIINMFFRLLNVQQYCDCGELHYSAPLFPIA